MAERAARLHRIAADGLLAMEVLGAYLQVRRELRAKDLRRTLATLRCTRPGRVGPAQAPARLARAVQRTLALVPGDTRCLTSSLVLTRLLARHGIASTLVIGVRPGVAFGAHAWVELQGRPLLPSGGDCFGRLVEL